MPDEKKMTPEQWADAQTDARRLADLMIASISDQQSPLLAIVLAALDLAMDAVGIAVERKPTVALELLALILMHRAADTETGATIQ